MSAPRVLIIEGDLAEAQNLEEAIFEIPERNESATAPDNASSTGSGLSRRYWWSARVLHASALEGGLEAVRDEAADLVLLNPALEERGGLEAYRRIKILAPELPVILLLDSPADEGIGRLALREGAQDAMLKSRCDWESLAHAMENALERGRLVKAMWKTFLLDAQTGLPNRQGFTYLASTLQAASRAAETPLRMMVAASTSGSAATEDEVARAAESLRACAGLFDLVGRLGTGQFGILSADLDVAEMKDRIKECEPDLTLRWSEWRPDPDSREGLDSIDRLITGTEMLLDQSMFAARAVQ
ncbi:hypothetical protein F183_A14920 [Bryobacterales bacterium F-183]|nr:hypothetical protein F183_A14920 [Bryobacterales bacterium F-183]